MKRKKGYCILENYGTDKEPFYVFVEDEEEE